MNIYALKGHRVILKTINAGSDNEKETVKQHLLLNETYTVDHTIVFGWRTDVYLQEIPGVAFNSVFFIDLVAQSQANNEKHPNYRRYH